MKSQRRGNKGRWVTVKTQYGTIGAFGGGGFTENGVALKVGDKVRRIGQVWRPATTKGGKRK